jgi:hypothetical protein
LSVSARVSVLGSISFLGIKSPLLYAHKYGFTV